MDEGEEGDVLWEMTTTTTTGGEAKRATNVPLLITMY